MFASQPASYFSSEIFCLNERLTLFFYESQGKIIALLAALSL